eukprot:TRINITY_DN7760_c0_g1_i1.p1 TRINITY_DN7760_c0_g1~~TRINITY_DN7760_c0_g1_i1.p1  ORF type:complete len:583 (+),score=125.38 TRINITY_DN7760_c0_g1_i1:79-1827(+)
MLRVIPTLSRASSIVRNRLPFSIRSSATRSSNTSDENPWKFPGLVAAVVGVAFGAYKFTSHSGNESSVVSQPTAVSSARNESPAAADLLKKTEPTATSAMRKEEHTIAHAYARLNREYEYVVVGGGVAAEAAVVEIKERKPDAVVLLISSDNRVPYQRPPLSKELWSSTDENVSKSLTYTAWDGTVRSVDLLSAETYAKYSPSVTVLLNTQAQALNADTKTLTLSDGNTIKYGKLLLATGGRPRHLNVPIAPAARAHLQTYRTVSDFQKLEAVVRAGGSVAIVGGGFLGSELSSALAKRGCKVIQVFREGGVLHKYLPRYLSDYTTQQLRASGADLRPYTNVKRIEEQDGKVVLVMDNNTRVMADHVVVSIGIDPNVQLAQSAHLELDRVHGGINVNTELAAASDIFAAGDCSSYHDRTLGRRRIEHFDHALSMGRIAGRNMTGSNTPYNHMSMFWADVSSISFEGVGELDARLEMVGTWPTAGQVYRKGVVYYLRDNIIVGVMMWNLHGKIDQARSVVQQRIVVEDRAALATVIAVDEEEQAAKKAAVSQEESAAAVAAAVAMPGAGTIAVAADVVSRAKQ